MGEMMPSTFQSGQDDDYESSYDRQISTWSEDLALCVVPMTRESALGYWNAVNRVECSEGVYEHFRECLSRFGE